MGDHAGFERMSVRGAHRYVVIVADPVTGEVDAFGPFEEAVASFEVARRRSELDSEDLGDVVVTSVVLTPPLA